MFSKKTLLLSTLVFICVTPKMNAQFKGIPMVRFHYENGEEIKVPTRVPAQKTRESNFPGCRVAIPEHEEYRTNVFLLVSEELDLHAQLKTTQTEEKNALLAKNLAYQNTYRCALQLTEYGFKVLHDECVEKIKGKIKNQNKKE